MKWLILPLLLYGIVLLSQRRMMFYPTPLSGATPSNVGLSYEVVTFQSGTTPLVGWFIPAPTEEKDPFTILYCHGNAANISMLLVPAQAFHKQGFSLFLFDYREYGASGRSPDGLSEECIVSDAQAAYDRLIQRGIPESRIIVWGHSLGSGVAARLATNRRPAACVLEGSFPSTFRLARRLYPFLIVPPFLIWDRFETSRHVRQGGRPVLVVHGCEDEIIPPDLGRSVFESAAEPKQWICVPGFGHNDLPLDHPQIREALSRLKNTTSATGKSHP